MCIYIYIYVYLIIYTTCVSSINFNANQKNIGETHQVPSFMSFVAKLLKKSVLDLSEMARKPQIKIRMDLKMVYLLGQLLTF